MNVRTGEAGRVGLTCPVRFCEAMVRLRDRESLPGMAACLAVGLLFAGLLVGYEPVGGDPDRIFRPIKAELSRSLAEGRLPFWSDRLGLGVPLVAESHVGAFYPLNWPLYGLLGVASAYRLSMWLHCVAIAAAVYAYARELGLATWGAALAGVTFPFCGFLTVHSSHEWAYQTLAYLPLCLLTASRYTASGRVVWLAALAALWGVQMTLGHFQVQMWTACLVIVTGWWQVIADHRPLRRALGLALGLAWGVAIAAVQLVPTWELAGLVGQTRRSFAELAFYSYPPGHWAEIAVPGLFRRLLGGPETPYWFGQQTTGYESCLFVGTLPLILAAVGLIGGGRGLRPWAWIVAASLALATMPRWWPLGYATLLTLPGLGYFRCPARYTAVASLGLAPLAGGGLDRAISERRFRIGLMLALAVGAGAFAWAVAWTVGHHDLLEAIGGEIGLAARLGLAAVSWVVAIAILLRWRRGIGGQAWTVLLVTAAELGAYYYIGGTTRWGRSVPLPDGSPVLSRLAREPGVGRVGGMLDNLPVRVGLTTATPYTGFPLLPPHPLLKAVQDRRNLDDPAAVRWLARLAVTHLVSDIPLPDRIGEVIYQGDDPALDVLAYRGPGQPEHRRWRVVRLAAAYPDARVATRAVTTTSYADLVTVLSRRYAPDEAWFLAGEVPPAAQSPRAHSAKILRWDGLAGEVEHDGACDLVLTRAHYPGWVARIGDGPERPVNRADGGLIAVRLDGVGVSRVSLRFRPNGLQLAAVVSATAIALALGSALVSIGVRKPSNIA